MYRVMVVDDEAIITMQLARRLELMGYEVVGTASSGAEALEKAELLRPDVILMDIVMPGKYDGIDAAEKIREELDIPVVFLTAYADDKFVERAKNVQPFGYVIKPYQEREIKAAIEVAVYKKDMERQLRKSQDMLRETKDYLESLIQYANAPIIVWEPEMRITLFNTAFERLTGYMSGEVIGQPFGMLFPEASRGESLAEIRRALSGEYWESVEIQILCKDGEIRIALWNSANIYDKDGKTHLATIAQGQDITERKQAEEALGESEEKFRTFMETASDLMSITDKDVNFTYVNDSMARTLGYSKEELIGMHITQIIAKEALEKDFKPNWDKFTTNGEISLETTLLTKEGKAIYCEIKAVAVYDSDGNHAGSRTISHDITERKQAEEALRESERKFRDLANLLPLSVWEIDLESNFTFINRRGLQWYNPALEELPAEMGRIEAALAFIPEDYERARTDTQRLQNGEDLGVLEYTQRRIDGSTFPVQVIAVPIIREGIIVGLRGVTIDITERKQAEKTLRQSEENLRSYLENAPDGVYINNMEGTFLYGNRKAEEITGYAREELIGQSFLNLNLLPVEYLATAAKAQALSAMGRPTGPDEFELTRKDGTRIWVSINTTTIEQGEERVVIGVARDITERKQAAEALKESEEYLGSILNSIQAGVTIVDAETRTIIGANPYAVNIIGAPIEEIIGQKCHRFVCPADAEKCPILDLGQSVDNSERELIDINGKSIPVLKTVTTIIMGGRKYLLESFVDLTERKEMEQKAREVETLRELDRLRSGLLSNVSHELRTPLTSIKGFASTLLRADVEWSEEEQRDFLMTIDREADRLTSLINDLLDMSRVDAEGLKLDKQDCTITEVLDSIGDALAHLTENHQLQIQLPPELPALFIDQRRIGQVLINLVENATKYSKQGTEITIGAQLKGDEIHFSVTDRGEGIAHESLERVFDRFYQAESIVTGRKSGTGLGLSICRGIVESHGGEIRAESKPGEGPRFTFSLPVGKREEEIGQDSGH